MLEQTLCHAEKRGESRRIARCGGVYCCKIQRLEGVGELNARAPVHRGRRLEIDVHFARRRAREKRFDRVVISEDALAFLFAHQYAAICIKVFFADCHE